MRKFLRAAMKLLITALLLVLQIGNHTYAVLAKETGYGNISERQNFVSTGKDMIKQIQQDIYASSIIRINMPINIPHIGKAGKPELSEEKVYTFLQGPKSWSEGITWSGEWCGEMAGGNSFGGFGCGLCCMANIYSTLSGYECSPLDMYEYAKDVSAYYPTGKSGAISWEDMSKTLKKTGFDSDLRRKPDTYEEFRGQMMQAKSAVVLISSYNDDTFWKATGGHYVNIWLYNNKTEEVFLAEPGSPDNNRSWIPLKYVYDALKTSSDYQYLTVSSYMDENNEWRWDGIDDNWNSP